MVNSSFRNNIPILSTDFHGKSHLHSDLKREYEDPHKFPENMLSLPVKVACKQIPHLCKHGPVAEYSVQTENKNHLT